MGFLDNIGEFLAGLFGTGASLYENKKNIEAQKEINQQNLDYATQMTTAQWERDDTNLQRQVRDAQIAGLSPLAVTGSMNSSSPLNYVAQAPQMDLTSLVGMATTLGSEIDRLNFEDKWNKENSKQKEADRVQNLLIETNKLNAQIEQWNKENEQTDSERENEIIRFNKTMLYQYDVLNSDNSKFILGENSKRLQNVSNASLEEYKNLCSSIGVSPKTKNYSNYSDYVEALGTFWKDYGSLALGRGFSGKSDVTSETNSMTGGLGLSIAGTGLNGSSGEATSSSQDTTKTNSYYDLGMYLNEVYFPIYVGKDYDSMDKYEYKSISKE